MKPASENTEIEAVMRDLPSITGAHRRTLDAIFHHPSAHNLEWSDVVALVGKIGEVHEQGGNKFLFEVAGKRLVLHKPHTKDLTSSDVLELRHFFVAAGLSAPLQPPSAPLPDPALPNLLIAIDHHETKIYHLDAASADTSEPVIRPYDPHHFLHHLVHKDQSRERGQRAPEASSYYAEIADAVTPGGKIVVVSHGEGKSNAGHHLVEFLQAHHPETYRRVVREIVADLSSVTALELLELARLAFHA